MEDKNGSSYFSIVYESAMETTASNAEEFVKFWINKIFKDAKQ